jgi:hypothetical protein
LKFSQHSRKTSRREHFLFKLLLASAPVSVAKYVLWRFLLILLLRREHFLFYIVVSQRSRLSRKICSLALLAYFAPPAGSTFYFTLLLASAPGWPGGKKEKLASLPPVTPGKPYVRPLSLNFFYMEQSL